MYFITIHARASILRKCAHLARLLYFCFLFLRAAVTEAQVFDPAKVGPPLSNAPAELYLPPGGSPTGAVVVLHGCNGVGPHYREWARRLAGWGFVALLIDSFGPRGFREVCNHGRVVPPEAQARWLRRRRLSACGTRGSCRAGRRDRLLARRLGG